MEKERSKMENSRSGEGRGRFPAFDSRVSTEDVCSACGSIAMRSGANYCLVCGKNLGEDYKPLDTIRSAHHLQGKSFLLENSETKQVADLFERNENGVSQTAWACFVYSLVPYLGILFIPFTLVVGSAGVAFSYKHPRAGGRKLALVSIGLSFFVLLLQVFLWWLLYVIPDIAGRV